VKIKDAGSNGIAFHCALSATSARVPTWLRISACS